MMLNAVSTFTLMDRLNTLTEGEKIDYFGIDFVVVEFSLCSLNLSLMLAVMDKKKNK